MAEGLYWPCDQIATVSSAIPDFSSTPRVTDANSINKAGLFSFAAGASNVPSGFLSTYGGLIVSLKRLQFAFGYYATDDSGAVYIRFRTANSGTVFSSWKKIN